jgi:hypothetical protein
VKELHPETKHGMRNGQTSKDADSASLEIPSFVADTATKTDVSSRVIHEEIQIAKNLTPEAKQAVRAVDMPKTEALKLARMKPEKQKSIADKIVSGAAKTVKDAAKQISQAKKTERKAYAPRRYPCSGAWLYPRRANF